MIIIQHNASQLDLSMPYRIQGGIYVVTYTMEMHVFFLNTYKQQCLTTVALDCIFETTEYKV